MGSEMCIRDRAHIAYRKKAAKEELRSNAFPVPLWPLGQYFSVFMILVTFGTMFWMSEFHSALIAGVVFTALMTIVYFFISKRSPLDAEKTDQLQHSS